MAMGGEGMTRNKKATMQLLADILQDSIHEYNNALLPAYEGQRRYPSYSRLASKQELKMPWGDFGLAEPAPTGPQAGTIEGGYKFKGGDPAKKENWEKVQ